MSDQAVEDKNSKNDGGESKGKAAVRVTTQRIATTQLEPVDIEPILAEVPPDALGLYIVDFRYLVLIEGAQSITLGREMDIEEASVRIDLTPYQGAPLGVSRRHAVIEISQNMCTVQDLGSTNGTWLNEARLPSYVSRMLNSGDMVRFGQVKTCVVFHSPKAAQGSVTNNNLT